MFSCQGNGEHFYTLRCSDVTTVAITLLYETLVPLNYNFIKSVKRTEIFERRNEVKLDEKLSLHLHFGFAKSLANDNGRTRCEVDNRRWNISSGTSIDNEIHLVPEVFIDLFGVGGVCLDLIVIFQ